MKDWRKADLKSWRTRNVGALLLVAVAFGASAERKATQPELKIIQDSLHESGNFYFVKGAVYNPHENGVKNVVIKYYIWKKWAGKEGHGTRIRDTGGLVVATLKYLPPKQSVEFTATSENAPVMTKESGLTPDPLNAEITAEWDDGK